MFMGVRWLLQVGIGRFRRRMGKRVTSAPRIPAGRRGIGAFSDDWHGTCYALGGIGHYLRGRRIMLLLLLMPFGNRTTPARRRASRGLSTRTFSVGRSPRRISHSAAGDEGMDFIAKAAIGVVLIGVCTSHRHADPEHLLSGLAEHSQSLRNSEAGAAGEDAVEADTASSSPRWPSSLSLDRSVSGPPRFKLGSTQGQNAVSRGA
jgi:hypothetical protein